MGRKPKYKTESEKKRARKARTKQYLVGRIIIGDQLERWRDLMKEKELRTDRDAAIFLLDWYNQSQVPTSTPGPSGANRMATNLPAVSPLNIAGPSSRVRLRFTAEAEDDDDEGMNTPSMRLRPFDSMDCSEDLNVSGLEVLCEKDESYLPSNLSLVDFMRQCTFNKHVLELDDDALEEIDDNSLVHCIQEQEEEDHDPDLVDNDDNNQSFSTEDHINDKPFIGYVSCIDKLIDRCLGQSCDQCQGELQVTKSFIGTCLYVKWSCCSGHKYTWASQPTLTKRGNHLGDVMLASSTLLSGNNFTKIQLLMKFLGFRPPRENLFFPLQLNVMVPVINEYWNQVQADTLAPLKGTNVIAAGDGRNDSPGHSSQYCTYTIMEENSHKLLSIACVDKRETGLKSPNMEPSGLKKALNELQDQGVNITELVTDAHVQIPPIMRERGILHQWDIWHGGKNFLKKLNQIASRSNCQELKPWVKDIINHFWYSAEHAEGDPLKFKATFRGILHHTVNKHEWLSGDGAGTGKCDHGPLDDEERDKPWLIAESEAHKALTAAVLDRNWLLKAGEMYCNFRHTGQLEVFHHHMLMYASKRHSFSPPVYRARMLLAGIDFMKHSDRDYRRDKDGNIQFRRVFNKRSQIWCPSPLKVPKEYHYIGTMQERILTRIQEEPGLLRKSMQLSVDDPRNIRPTIAAVSPAPTHELVEAHRSRLGTKNTWSTDQE